jgi:hypothetical protein
VGEVKWTSVGLGQSGEGQVVVVWMVRSWPWEAREGWVVGDGGVMGADGNW